MIAEVTVGALLSILSNVALGFPDGAPIEACILPHANSPNHAGTKPMPHQTEHHQFTASSGTYTPGDLVEGEFEFAPIFRRRELLPRCKQSGVSFADSVSLVQNATSRN